jgi:hypothetical protein
MINVLVILELEVPRKLGLTPIVVEEPALKLKLGWET